MGVGDVVVGRYNDFGGRIEDSKTIGDSEDLERIQKELSRHAEISGATLMKPPIPIKPGRYSDKKKPGKLLITKKDIKEAMQAKLTNDQAAVVASVKQEPKKKMTVYLHNALGKIKLSVEAVLESEMAYCLVFANDDDVIFVPNAGETLTFINTFNKEFPVYYTNTLFSWTDGIKQLMVLFKDDSDKE